MNMNQIARQIFDENNVEINPAWEQAGYEMVVYWMHELPGVGNVFKYFPCVKSTCRAHLASVMKLNAATRIGCGLLSAMK